MLFYDGLAITDVTHTAFIVNSKQQSVLEFAMTLSNLNFQTTFCIQKLWMLKMESEDFDAQINSIDTATSGLQPRFTTVKITTMIIY